MPLFVVAVIGLGFRGSLLGGTLAALFGVFGLLAFGLLSRLVLFVKGFLWESIKKNLHVVSQLAWSLISCRQLLRSEIESRSWLTEFCRIFQVPMVTLAFRINIYYTKPTFWVLVGSDISLIIGCYGLGPTSLAEI